jgi:hypothetical protein
VARTRSNFLSIKLADPSEDFVRQYKGEVSKGISRDIAEFNRRIEPKLEALYKSHAPRKSGRLRRSITAKARRIGHAGEWEVTVGAAVSRGRTHFNYVPVTRFGHRRIRIFPKRAARLRFRYRGKLIFAKSSAGFRPSRDWTIIPSQLATRLVEQEKGTIGVSVSRRGRSIRAT